MLDNYFSAVLPNSLIPVVKEMIFEILGRFKSFSAYFIFNNF